MTNVTPEKTAKTPPDTPVAPAAAPAKAGPVRPVRVGGAKPAKAFKPVIVFTNDKV
jgi:hypothetical protein